MNKKGILLLIIIFIQCYCTIAYGYSNELQSAYTWAYNNWITTQSTIDKANMNWEITRIELSKMISNYVINVLKKKTDTSKKCNFSDITGELNKKYDNWVTKACQLWLMWQGITKFRPYDKVTRAEFWTILSRALYWEKYNWWNPYYTKHLNQLNLDWIIKNINNAETRKEIRWYVMLMMMRSQNVNLQERTEFNQKTWDSANVMISQVKLNDNFYVKKLWALNDQWIGDAVWFHDFYWDYFIKDDWLPSMFSCEDSITNPMKENIKNNCSRYEVWNDKYSFIIFWEPKLKVKEWVITFWDTISILEYSLWNTSFEDLIKNSKEWLDNNKYCLKKHYYWNYFSHSNKYWVPWFWKNLNTLSNEWNITIYDIHEKLGDGTCWNNNPWVVFYINNSNYFNVILSLKPNWKFWVFEWNYSTSFSIDIK